MKLTPDDFERIEAKRLAAVLRKVQGEKPLTAREELLLAKARAAGAAPGVQASGESAGNYAQTWDELADACNVDRRTITNARTNFGREITEREKEWSRADGRKEIAWWVRFLADKGIRGRGVNNPDADFIDERALRLKREKVQLDKAEFDLAKAKESMLPVVEFESALSTTVGQFNAVLNAMPGRAASKIVARARAALLLMLKGSLTVKQFEKVEQIMQTAPIDYADIEEILQTEADLAKRTLEQCEYLKPADGLD